jgi:hypothetical protein
MSSSTPLNQLPSQQPPPPLPPQELDNSNDMVEDILNEMSNSNNGSNNDSLNYAMDPSQIPPDKMDVNFLETPQQNSDQPLNNQENLQNNNATEVKSNSILSKLNLGSMEGTLSKCFNSTKSAVIVFVLVLVVSLPKFNKIVFTKLPKMLSESGEINIKGVLLKAILCSVLFLVSSLLI